LYGHFNSNDAARSFILLFSGVAAGLVAKQIKEGINNSLHQAERRHKVENLFGQQISMEIAGKMLESDGKIESKRMTVAVMFIDIRNFTQFAAGRSPEEIVQYQNAFFSIVVNCVARHNGIVNQFLGDGCMVTFGAPVVMNNPGSVAVQAARGILDEVETAMKNNLLIDTRIGIGIHTGEAVTGNIGTEFRQQYSITGNVVIVASRIEQLNKQYDSQILVSEDIVRNIKNKSISAEFMDTVVLKGMHDLFRIYKVA
jgi:adenylate cyclase